MGPRFDLVIVNGTVVTASDIRYFRNIHDLACIPTDYWKSAARIVLESKMERLRLFHTHLIKMKLRGPKS